MHRNNSERGQILPLALVGMISILGMIVFLLNAGNLMIARERARMHTDVATLSGATVYARCLNFDAALKKADEFLGTIAKVTYVVYGIGFLVEEVQEVVHEIKEGFEEAAPYITLGCTELNAIQNGLIAAPLWNVKDIYDPSQVSQGIAPDLKFGTNDEANSNNSDQSSSEDRYSYRKKSSGEEVEVSSEQVADDEDGGAKGRSRDQKSGRFVKKEKGKEAEAKGEHSITLITFSFGGEYENNLKPMKELPIMYSVARARISGGDFDFSSPTSLQWDAYLAPVTPKDYSMSLNISEMPMTGWASIDKPLKKVNALIRQARQWANRVPAILH